MHFATALLEIANAKNGYMILFMDYKNAFDSIPITEILNAVGKNGKLQMGREEKMQQKRISLYQFRIEGIQKEEL